MSLVEALSVQQVKAESDGSALYRGLLSQDWALGPVPQGGYVVGVALAALEDFQSTTNHPDPIHITAHFLFPTECGECSIQIKCVRTGKNMTNLDAEIIQKGKVLITLRSVFGVLPDLTCIDKAPANSLLQTSPIARRISLTQHPSVCPLDKQSLKYLFQNKSEDRHFKRRNQARSQGALKNDVHGGGELEWAAWFELKDERDEIRTSVLPFIADSVRNAPMLLPSQKPGPSWFWFATVVLTVEFKSKVPKSAGFAARTTGIYATSRFLFDGRHDELVEVWTAPSAIGETSCEVDPNWKDKQVCLVLSTQMALTIPVNASTGLPTTNEQAAAARDKSRL